MRLPAVLALSCAVGVGGYSKYDRDVVYEFESSLEGWGAAAASEMGIDVAARGGHLVGTVGGGPFVDAPHLDSPPHACRWSAARIRCSAARRRAPPACRAPGARSERPACRRRCEACTCAE